MNPEYLLRSLCPSIFLAIVLVTASSTLDATAQTNCVPAPSGLVSWWPAEGNAFDIASGNNATQTNGITFVPGLSGLAFNFDGSSSLITVPASPSLNVSSLTIEAWIFPTDPSTPRPIFEYADATGLSALNFWYNLGAGAQPASGALFGFARDATNGNNNFYLASAGGLLPTNQWTHVAFAFDSVAETAVLYVNGASVVTNSFNVPVHPNTGLAVNLGYRPVGSADLYAGFRHKGKLDEVSLYGRALSASEINAIYQAGSAGKCSAPRAPAIVQQPTNQSVTIGGATTFSVLATGTMPLSYQWLFGGTVVPGGSTSTLTIGKVQASDAGSYAVVISNSSGSITSSVVSLTVTSLCVAPPAGLVSWWQAESNAVDFIGENNGQPQSGVAYGKGRVGTAFLFDGISSKVDLGDPVSLAFTNSFSIEGWIWINGLPPAGQGHGLILYRGDPRFCLDPYYLAVEVSGNLRFHIEDAQDSVPCGVDVETGPLGMNQWVHVAGVFDSSSGSMQIYTNGNLGAQMTTAVRPFQDLVGGGTAIGNLSAGQNGMCFNGLIDELSVYNRSLAPSEIQGIYNAGSNGKCSGLFAPTIVTQPESQAAFVGDKVIFSVVAAGSAPLSYQWQKNKSPLTGATANVFTLSTVQLSDAGVYSVIVSNANGTSVSSNATLTVSVAPPCVAPVSGLIGWWKGENNANDSAGGNNGALRNGASFGPGRVGQAFEFTPGANQFVEIPDAPNQNPANAFTIETWVYVSANPSTDLGVITSKQNPSALQYQLETYLVPGRLSFRTVISVPAGLVYFYGNTTVQLNTWYHVAMTYDNAMLKLYVNGTLDGSAAATGPITPIGEPMRIGGVGTGPWDFAGKVDELSLYDRALSASEIQGIIAAGSGGKCLGPVAPSFVLQPQNQSALVGGSATFTAAVGGSLPLNYQWLFNNASISGATNSSLALPVVSLSSAGSYSVVVSNAAGSVTSSPAVLSVTLPPASVQSAGPIVAPDGTVTAPVNLVANGNENAVSFSLNFDPKLLHYESAALGDGASTGNLLLNSSQTASGQLGVAIALSAGSSFAAGTQQLVLVRFSSPIITMATSSSISFGDTPIKRQLADASGVALSATFVSGSVLLPPTELEGDVYPRPNGDEALTISDWVLVGRYVAGLDSPTNSSEFQRADCAPRSTLGDGLLTVSDWVQAGRYAAGLDPVTRVGGPASPVPMVVTGPLVASIGRKTQSNPRQVRALAPMLAPGQAGTIEVALEAQGDENALAFSLAFDPAKLVFTGVAIGSGAAGTTLNVNTNQAVQGRLGLVLALKANQSFTAGSKQLVQVSFRATTSASGTTAVSFSDQPVTLGVCDPAAATLAAEYVDGTVAITPLPSLKIITSSKSVTLSWPASASGFLLQESTDSTLAAASWKTVTATPSVLNNETVVWVPLRANSTFYRLYRQ